MSDQKSVILVASATGNAGFHVTLELSKAGATVRAMTRNPTGEKAQKLAKLPGVTVVQGDFNDEASVAAALTGVTRAFLASACGEHEQFDREVNFIATAQKEGIEGIVRIATCSFMTHPGSTNVYGRAHACIESYSKLHNSPVVHLHPSWFMQNILQNAGEAKATGQITWPCDGDGKLAHIDVRDLGNAAAMILLSDRFSDFLSTGDIEVHGSETVSINETLAALSSHGKELKLNPIPSDAWVGAMQGFGLTKLLARSLQKTFEICNGTIPPTIGSVVNTTSPLLLEIGWAPQHTIQTFAAEHAALFQ